MKEKVFRFIKEVYKSMSNKTAEVINAARMFVESRDLAKYEIINDKRLLKDKSNSLISAGIGVAALGLSLVVKGILIRKEI